jgi:hypothetical protein
MHSCPKCTSVLHRSHVRNGWERLRKRITRRRPYRCHNCEWRGWGGDPADHAAENNPDPSIAHGLAAGSRADFDLEQIDAWDRRPSS